MMEIDENRFNYDGNRLRHGMANLFVEVQFYWNTAIYLCFICNYLQSAKAELNSC